jgi:hypothetical protein
MSGRRVTETRRYNIWPWRIAGRGIQRRIKGRRVWRRDAGLDIYFKGLADDGRDLCTGHHVDLLAAHGDVNGAFINSDMGRVGVDHFHRENRPPY